MDRRLIERGMQVANSAMFQEDKIWSTYSGDKVDIGERMMAVLRVLMHGLPPRTALRAASLGSSDEPQFRVLEAACRGGLYLVDIAEEPLRVVKERLRRQRIDHVKTVQADFVRCLTPRAAARRFCREQLDGRRLHLVTLHHSLYYCPSERWQSLVEDIYQQLLGPTGALHAVLMAARSNDPRTTTWLYNHFAGKFCHRQNDQDLARFGRTLRSGQAFRDGRVLSRRSQVQFWVDDFEQFMGVVWMVLLYPNVHQYTESQRYEVTVHVYRNFWKPQQPLLQLQDHLAIYRGLAFMNPNGFRC